MVENNDETSLNVIKLSMFKYAIANQCLRLCIVRSQK